jgi:glutathione synthase/RimK-type ligase-like ATP-grasp enzyme
MILIGNPANRRVTLFQAALAAQGHPPARVVAWRDLAEAGAPARLLVDVPPGAVVRIDSAGEDAEVERAFLRRGEAAARAAGHEAIEARGLDAVPREPGRILYPRQAHLGFLAAVEEIAAALPAGARVLPPPSAIALLFDKAATSTRCRVLGLPVPEALPPVRDPEELREAMRAASWSTVFVKLTCGSSASCLALFSRHAGSERLVTTVEDTGSARYNTLQLQHLRTRRRIDRVLAFILGEGAHVERAVPKARLDGLPFDLRVLVVDGEPAFVVVRCARHAITNLHLGGRRGDLAALRARVPPAAWDRAMASCVALQRSTGAFHVGVDLLLEPGFERHRVIEGNAFGDLLPNLERDGLDVYGWQIRRLLLPRAGN